jgi:hypothetical protein
MKELTMDFYDMYLNAFTHLKKEGHTFRLIRDTGKNELHIAIFDKDKNRKFHWKLLQLMDEKIFIKKLHMPYMEVRFMSENELWDKEIK